MPALSRRHCAIRKETHKRQAKIKPLACLLSSRLFAPAQLSEASALAIAALAARFLSDFALRLRLGLGYAPAPPARRAPGYLRGGAAGGRGGFCFCLSAFPRVGRWRLVVFLLPSGGCVCPLASGGVPVFLFPVVSGSAVGCGASSWLVRASSRSASGFVLVASFSSCAAASAFARRWAVRLPAVCRGCAVRRSGASWCVSVPVWSVPLSLCGVAV